MPQLEGDGASIHYETAGEQRSPAILLVHAGIATIEMWEPLIPALAESHFVIAYDCRGFGQSSSESIHFSERDDARRLLDHLGVDRATVIGCSRGGRLAIDLAVETPERVAGLVIVGGAPSGFPDVELSAAEEAIITQADEAFANEDWSALAELEVQFWCVGARRDAATVDTGFLETARHLNRVNPARLAENPVPNPLEPPSYDRTVDIAVPTLVAVGDHDSSATLAQYEYLVSTIPQADSVRFPDSAHLPSVEQPEEFERVVLRWLSEHGL